MPYYTEGRIAYLLHHKAPNLGLHCTELNAAIMSHTKGKVLLLSALFRTYLCPNFRPISTNDCKDNLLECKLCRHITYQLCTRTIGQRVKRY